MYILCLCASRCSNMILIGEVVRDRDCKSDVRKHGAISSTNKCSGKPNMDVDLTLGDLWNNDATKKKRKDNVIVRTGGNGDCSDYSTQSFRDEESGLNKTHNGGCLWVLFRGCENCIGYRTGCSGGNTGAGVSSIIRYRVDFIGVPDLCR